MKLYLLVLLSCACGRAAESAPEAEPTQPEPFPIASPTVKDVSLVHEYVADVRAAHRAELRARFRGVIEAVAIDEGGAVKAGQTLFTINARARTQDQRIARAAVAAAQAELEGAELELHATEGLAEKHVVSEAELARTRSAATLRRAKLEEAKAAAARADVELDQARVEAPFAGVIDRIPHREGTTIAEGDLLTTVTDSRDVYAYFAISEHEYLTLLHGTQPRAVDLKLADGTMFDQHGTIDAVGGELDPQSSTLTYRARFANPAGVLKHGSSGKVVMKTELPHVMVIPQKSAFEVQGDMFVYVVDGQNIVHAKKLAIRARTEDGFVVDSGLAPTDRFVAEGVHKLRDGAAITPRS